MFSDTHNVGPGTALGKQGSWCFARRFTTAGSIVLRVLRREATPAWPGGGSRRCSAGAIGSSGARGACLKGAHLHRMAALRAGRSVPNRPPGDDRVLARARLKGPNAVVPNSLVTDLVQSSLPEGQRTALPGEKRLNKAPAPVPPRHPCLLGSGSADRVAPEEPASAPACRHPANMRAPWRRVHVRARDAEQHRLFPWPLDVKVDPLDE